MQSLFLFVFLILCKKSFGSSARHDRYLTELPKIREKKGGKQGESKKQRRKFTTAFEGKSHSRGTVARATMRFVGLLTQTFGRSSASTRRTRLLSAPLQSFNDPLSRCAPSSARRAGTSFTQLQIRPEGLTRVRDFHPIPLFSEEQACVSGRWDRVAHSPQKPKCVFFCLPTS